MALIRIRDNPSQRELRQFAGLWFLLFAIIVALVTYSVTRRAEVSIGIVAAGLATALIGVVRPAFIHPVYLLWMYAAYPIGLVISHVILAAIFFGLFMPIALVMRLVGYDPMRRRLDRPEHSDWVPAAAPGDKSEYFKQF